jgi:hypothetical protein
VRETSNLKARIKFLKMANKGISPITESSPSEVIDLLSVMRDEGLIKFLPNNIINSGEKIVLTDSGHKRLDEMKRSKYPDFLKWSALTGFVAIAIFLITGK